MGDDISWVGRRLRMNVLSNEDTSGTPAISPGTVSKILWHFTGGPSWDAAARHQNTAPKPASLAYKNLKSILRSKSLKLGDYKEVVTISLPDRRRALKSRRAEIVKGGPVTIESSPVCCVSDIPAPHLRYHAYRYGKFALGFHRDAIIRAGFNPVFYTLDDTPVVRSIYRGLSSLDVTDHSRIRELAESVEWELGEKAQALDVVSSLDDIGYECDSLEDEIGTAAAMVKSVLSFIKTFRRTEFSTIYCEREWRSTAEFRFAVDDLAMVVVPKMVGGNEYYRPFVERVAPRLKLPRRVAIVAWDDLVEH